MFNNFNSNLNQLCRSAIVSGRRDVISWRRR